MSVVHSPRESYPIRLLARHVLGVLLSPLCYPGFSEPWAAFRDPVGVVKQKGDKRQRPRLSILYLHIFFHQSQNHA